MAGVLKNRTGEAKGSKGDEEVEKRVERSLRRADGGRRGVGCCEAEVWPGELGWGNIVVQSVSGFPNAAARMRGRERQAWHSVNASIAARLPPKSSPQTVMGGKDDDDDDEPSARARFLVTQS